MTQSPIPSLPSMTCNAFTISLRMIWFAYSYKHACIACNSLCVMHLHEMHARSVCACACCKYAMRLRRLESKNLL